MIAALRSLAVVALAVGAVAAEPALQPTGLFRARCRIDRPLAHDGTTVLTAHLVNICEAPLRLAIEPRSYLPMFIDAALPAAKNTSELDHAVWGPDIERSLTLSSRCIRVSGVGEDGRLPDWPARDGVTLLQDEGYARRVTLLPGWIAPDAVPAGRTAIAIMASPALSMSLPKLEAGAVAPGRPIEWADPVPVYAPGFRLLPYVRSAAKADAAKGEAAEQPQPPAHESGLRLAIELPEEVEARRDLEVTYLIGNEGPATVWVRQNGLGPALATWTLERRGKPVAQIDGAALSGMLDLLPERAPLALNPGEWLTFRRVLLASALPLKPRDVCTLRLRLEAPWLPATSGVDDQPRLAPLECAVTMRVGEAP